jgi:hypothetical protein
MPERAVKGMGRMGGAKQVGVLFFYLMLALLATYPLVSHLATGVLGPPGDNFEYLYKLWWFKRALFDLGVSPFFTADVFYPQGYHLALHEMSLANISLGMPLTLCCGEISSYNGLALLSFVLSGFGMYVLAFHVTGARLAALLSGVAFAFAAYRMGHLGAGHLNLLGTQWLPFLMLSLERLLATRKMRLAVLCGVFFALSALSSWYYAPMFAIVAGLYVIWRTRQQRGHRARTAPEWSGAGGAPWEVCGGKVWCLLAVSGLVAGLLMAPSFLATAQQWGQREMSFSLREVDVFSASLGDWLVPNVLHPLWGRLVAGRYATRQDVPEYMISLSWVALSLAAVGLWVRQKQGQSLRQQHISSAYVVLFVLSVVLALGTTLHLGGQRVYIAVPKWIERGFTGVMGLLANRLALHAMPSYYELRVPGAVYVPLPTLLLYLYVPFFDSMRVWTRFGLISSFAVAALSGLGLARILRSLEGAGRSSRRTLLIALTGLVLIAFELIAIPYPLGWSEVKAQPADRWLAQQPEGGAVMRFPLWQAECGTGLYAATVHGRPLAYGYGAFFPGYYRQKRPVLWDFPTVQSIALLRDWGVKYVLVGSEGYGAQWPDVQQRLDGFEVLQLVAAFSEEPVYHAGWLARLLPDFGRAFIVDQVYVYQLG